MLNEKKALFYCHRQLTKSGSYGYARAILHYMNGDKSLKAFARSAILIFSLNLKEQNLL